MLAQANQASQSVLSLIDGVSTSDYQYYNSVSDVYNAGMVVQNNMKSTQKLSSGYKINRAADDAAGLAISNKMQQQVQVQRRPLDAAEIVAQYTEEINTLIEAAQNVLNQQDSDVFNVLSPRVVETTSYQYLMDGRIVTVTQTIDTYFNNMYYNNMYLNDMYYNNLYWRNVNMYWNNMYWSNPYWLSVEPTINVQDTMLEELVNMKRSPSARYDYTVYNLDNVVENVTAAESRIRDTDMAKEMVAYTKNNILAQAGQSMLAQANQSTQAVLSLLQ